MALPLTSDSTLHNLANVVSAERVQTFVTLYESYSGLSATADKDRRKIYARNLTRVFLPTLAEWFHNKTLVDRAAYVFKNSKYYPKLISGFMEALEEKEGALDALRTDSNLILNAFEDANNAAYELTWSWHPIQDHIISEKEEADVIIPPSEEDDENKLF